MKTKPILLFAALLALTAPAAAQNVHHGESFELNAPLSSGQNHEYTADSHIDLINGFDSQPDSGNNTLLQIDSEGYEIHPPEEGLTNDKGCVVGSLGGTVNIGAMGGLLYSIPLELPAGINGMQPGLSVTYNSQAGNGLLGWGWDLSGLSAIERTGQTRYHDGKMTAANLSSNDRFLLDGQRLVAVADYSDSVEYRMERDGMSRIMAYKERIEGLLGLLGFKHITCFKVWRPDGIIMEYGASDDSWIEPQNGGFHALCWLLDKVTDRNGNSIVYHYYEDQPNGRFWIQSIEYTKNESQETEAQFVISFDYDENRRDYEQYYIKGNTILFKHLLTQINVARKSDSKPLYRYDFSYYKNGNPYHHYNRLLSIGMTVFDPKGNYERTNPTTISWNVSDPSKVTQYTITNPEIFENFPFTGDFNGDGYTDVALVPYKDSTVYPGPVSISVYLNDRNRGFEYVASMGITNLPASLDWVHVLDINGDGLDDLVPCFYDTVPSAHSETTSVKVYLNNPSNQSFNYLGYREIGNKGDVIVGDFDGNGISDVILLEKGFNVRPFVQNVYFLGFEDNQFQSVKLNTGSLADLGAVYNAVAADYNGDGISEVLLLGIDQPGYTLGGTKIGRFDFNDDTDCFKVMQDFAQSTGHSWYPYYGDHHWSHVFPGDFNGDGKMDILFDDGNTWRICFSEGNRFGNPHEISGSCIPKLNQYCNLFYPSLRSLEKPLPNQYYATVVVSDFDGDGCADLGFTLSDESKFYIETKISMINTGHISFRDKIYSKNTIFNNQFIHVGNFLGRDNPAFLGRVRPSNWKETTVKICSLCPVSQYNSVTSVTDGLGNATSFTYACLTPKAPGTSAPFYTHSYAAPDANGVLPVPLAVRALNTCAVEGPNGSQTITRYRYHNAMCHKYGHGFMGFETTVAETFHNSTDSPWVTRKVSCNEHSTMGQYAMMLPQSETIYINCNGTERMTGRTQYYFANAKFASGLTDLVVCPAMLAKAEDAYSMDSDNELIKNVATSYIYNYNSNHTYDNAYGCTSSYQSVTGFINGNPIYELQTTKHTELQTMGASWIVNRPLNETVTHLRNVDFSSSHTVYTYCSADSYLPQTITVSPNDGTLPCDPLTLSTTYEYDAFGNVTGTMTEAPYGLHDETPRSVSYEFSSDYQHRLPTKETKGKTSDGYITLYSYDFRDRPASVTDCNGMQTVSETSVLGTDLGMSFPDGTEQRDQTLWADFSPYKPEGACYYTWSKKTGNAATMTFYHKSGTELRTVTFDFHGHPVFVDKRYNSKGLLDGVSDPYRMGEPTENILWTVYHYDDHDRIVGIDYPDGSAKAYGYDGLATSTTATPPQGSPVMTPQTTSKKTNALGWLRECVDADGTSVFYEYHPDGNLKWMRIGSDETTKVTMEYDRAGNRTRLHDPDYCTAQQDLVSVYNAYGEEMSRTTPGNFHTEFTYDKFGRMTNRHEEYEVAPNLTEMDNTSWSYYETVPHKGLLGSVTGTGQTVSYNYDNCQRLFRETVQYAGGESHFTEYAYDRASRVASIRYPSGVTVSQYYNSRGYPSVQTDSRKNELCRTKATSPMGQIESFTLGGVLHNTLEYDPEKHLLARIKTTKNNATIQNFSFTYDGFCNLASRKDHMKNLEETFTYDSQNRLTEVWLGATQTGASAYDSYGRMTSKSAGGQAVFYNAAFNTAKPHAVAAATTSEGAFPATAQTVTYTGFDKARKIKQGNDSICYTYGYDHQRIFMEEHIGNTVRTKRYVGNCEYVTETEGNTVTEYWLTYLTGPTGVYAVAVTQSGTSQTHYILKDNLGSWTTIADSEGVVEQRLSYDAWGNLRNPNTWSGSFTGVPMFDRGFTGHEHLYNFVLINMNGRMYDPTTSSFLSVDQYVNSPENAQGFNRYAYCLNNPLRYVDPSGWRPVGGGASGYTPNSSANANDPYAFVEHGSLLEPRDVGKRQFDTSDPIITWMEGNERHGGGSGGGQLSEPTQVADGEDPPEGATVHSGNSIFFKAFWHYQFGNKEDYWIDASTLYFGFITQKELSYEKDGTATINLYDYFEAGEYALALGKISLKPVGNNLFEIKPDDYNFNIEWQFGWNKRNIATAASGFIHGPVIDDVPIPTHWMGGKPCYAQPSVFGGGPFKFRFSNYVYIKP